MEEPIAKKEYYSIGDVCDLAGLRPHVLRYWETQFDVLHPKKNRAGNRVYRPAEVQTVLLVKRLLYEEKFTIAGAKLRIKELRKDKGLDLARTEALTPELLTGMRRDLGELLDTLDLGNDAWDEGVEA
jgi:DNA-binding transcriptional MerR regulator